jgi:hypothetical protein
MNSKVIWAFLAGVSLRCGGEHTTAACPAYAAAGLDVSVSNASSRQPICDATVTATEGAYSEQLFGVACSFTGAIERPGTYVVRAARQGFAPKEVAPVRVAMGGGECPHVQQTQVRIELDPDDGLAPR